MIIANDVSQDGIGFNAENNAVTVICSDKQQVLPLASKQKIAHQLISLIYTQMKHT